MAREIVRLPNSNALIACMEIATRPESAAHFAEGFINRVELSRQSFPEMEKVVTKFRDEAFLALLDSTPAWNGQPVRSHHQAMASALGAEAAKRIMVKEMEYGVIVNEKSEILRRCMANGVILDPSSNDVIEMDDAFQNWLQENNLKFEDNTVYETSAQGVIKVNSQGEKVRVSPEELKSLVQSNRFRDFIHRAKPDLNVTTVILPAEAKAVPQPATR